MATDVYGLPTQPLNVGTGYEWLPFLNQRDQLLANLYGTQGNLGLGVLGHLTNLLTDPTAGPLGLSAFARYGGGAQNIAQGTGGQGIQSPYSGLLDNLLRGISGSVMNPGSPFNPANNGQYNTDAAKIDPNKVPMMSPESAAKAPADGQQEFWKQWNNYTADEQKRLRDIASGQHGGIGYPASEPPGYDTGGGMTIGGKPHFIVDDSGKAVAALTEDGKPEHVSPFGGVEITPLDPARNEAYLKSKQMGDVMGRLMGGIMGPDKEYATGGMALFPKIPGSPVNSGDPGGTTTLPGIGGGESRTRQEIVGPYFKPNDQNMLPSEAYAPDANTRLKGYAKLFGGALSAGNTAVDANTLKSLNAGQAPAQLLSSQALGTLLPSQRSNYFALLQQMGLGRPEDLAAQIQRFTPSSMI